MHSCYRPIAWNCRMCWKVESWSEPACLATMLNPPPSHILIPTVHSGQTVLAGDATPGSRWSPRASCGPPAGESWSCHLSVSHPPPCLLPTVPTLRWPHEPQHQDIHWVSGYCYVTVMWLSCDCHVTVIWRSCDCHVTVMWLSCECVWTSLSELW